MSVIFGRRVPVYLLDYPDPAGGFWVRLFGRREPAAPRHDHDG